MLGTCSHVPSILAHDVDARMRHAHIAAQPQPETALPVSLWLAMGLRREDAWKDSTGRRCTHLQRLGTVSVPPLAEPLGRVSNRDAGLESEAAY